MTAGAGTLGAPPILLANYVTQYLKFEHERKKLAAIRSVFEHVCYVFVNGCFRPLSGPFAVCRP